MEKTRETKHKKNNIEGLRVLMLCVLCAFVGKLYAQKEVRTLLQQAAREEASCKKLLSLLQPYNENNNALLAGYKACGIMMMARYVFNPVRKFSFFSKGKKSVAKIEVFK